MTTLVNLLGENPCIVNILLGPVTVHCIEVLLYISLTITNRMVNISHHHMFHDMSLFPTYLVIPMERMASTAEFLHTVRVA